MTTTKPKMSILFILFLFMLIFFAPASDFVLLIEMTTRGCAMDFASDFVLLILCFRFCFCSFCAVYEDDDERLCCGCLLLLLIERLLMAVAFSPAKPARNRPESVGSRYQRFGFGC